MTPALGMDGSSVTLGPNMPTSQLRWDLGAYFMDASPGQLPWPRATGLWPLCPSGHQRGSHGGGRELKPSNTVQSPFLWTPYPLHSAAPTPLLLNSSSAPPTSASPLHKRSDWPRKGRADWHIKWWHFVTDWSGLQQSACQWALHFFPQANVTLKLNRIFFHPTCCFLCHILF